MWPGPWELLLSLFIFGVPVGFIWFILRYQRNQLLKALDSRASETELTDVRVELDSLRRTVEELQEQVAELTLQLDDAAKDTLAEGLGQER